MLTEMITSRIAEASNDDRTFWLTIRRALLLIVRAIEDRYDVRGH